MKSKSASVIIGIGSTGCYQFRQTASHLMMIALYNAMNDAGNDIFSQIDGLIMVPPTIGEPQLTFAIFASESGIAHKLNFCANVPTMGAGPVSAILLARQWIQSELASVVAVVAGDSLTSLGTNEMLSRMGKTINHPDYQNFSQPIIPILYDRVAEWHIKKYGTKREHLAMVPVLMSIQAHLHPKAMNQKILTLDDVLESRPVGKVTNLLECARPADGAGAVIITSHERARDCEQKPVYIFGGGEAHGLQFLPDISAITEDIFPARRAARAAFKNAAVELSDISWYGIYDCFPICFLRFIEECGITRKAESGDWIEWMHKQYLSAIDPNVFPVNTHGGLLSFGAPWAAPAIFSVIEAVEQIRGKAGKRQVESAHTALVYGNGGIFTHAACAILGSI